MRWDMNVRTKVELVVPIAFVLFLLGGEVVVHRPRREELRALGCEVASAEQGLASLIDHSGDLMRVEDFIPRRTEGEDGADRQFLSHLSDELERLGLVITRVEPQQGIEGNRFSMWSYLLEIEGSYDAFVSILTYLERLPELVVVDSFDLRSSMGADGGWHQASLRLTVIG